MHSLQGQPEKARPPSHHVILSDPERSRGGVEESVRRDTDCHGPNGPRNDMEFERCPQRKKPAGASRQAVSVLLICVFSSHFNKRYMTSSKGNTRPIFYTNLVCIAISAKHRYKHFLVQVLYNGLPVSPSSSSVPECFHNHFNLFVRKELIAFGGTCPTMVNFISRIGILCIIFDRCSGMYLRLQHGCYKNKLPADS